LLSVTLILSKNNLAFRGSSDKFYTQSNGNVLSLGKHDDVTKGLLFKTLSHEFFVRIQKRTWNENELLKHCMDLEF